MNKVETSQVSRHTPGPYSISGIDDANKQFIVTALNSHYELLEACRSELEALKTWRAIHNLDSLPDLCEGIHISIDKLERALSHATGGQPEATHE